METEIKWYIGVVISGRERTTAERINRLAETSTYQGKIIKAIVPTVKEEDARGKMKETVVYPTYVFIQMELSDLVRYGLKSEGMSVVLGKTDGAVAISDEDIERMLQQGDE